MMYCIEAYNSSQIKDCLIVEIVIDEMVSNTKQ